MIRLIGFSFLFCCLVLPLKGQINYDVCAGDTLELSVTVALNNTIQWQQSLDGTAFYNIPGATLNSYTVAGVMTTRYYRCEITGPECNPWFSEIKMVNVHQLPVLIISGLDPVYCISANPVNLSGNPSGGIFAGNGITGNIFSPSAAGTGNHNITYSYTDGAGCKNTTSVTTGVVGPPTVANAGPDITATAVTVAMAANAPLIGTGSWSVLSGTGGSFAAPSSPTSNFTGTPNNVYSLLWTINNLPCAASSDTVVVTMPTGPALPSVYCGTSSATLYVHPADNAGPILWGCVGITTAANDLNNGAANTALIVQLCGPGTAAGICDALVAYGYSDWYLPSYNELECVRANSVAIGGFSADKYWSSNEGAGILYLNAYYRTFPSGTSGAGSKSSTMARVRCIRKD